jgi:hypothetical protein
LTKHGPNPGHDLAWIERFTQILSAQFRGHDVVILLDASREQDDG